MAARPFPFLASGVVSVSLGSAVCGGQLLRCGYEENDAAVWFRLTICGAALQVAAGALSLLLPYHRRLNLLYLAYLAAAVAVVSRCMAATVISLDAADPGLGYLLSHVGRTLCASGIFLLAVAEILSLLERICP
ncbi:hypothetical protein ACQJBY_050181 [Aegilops geniculata]